MQPQRTRQVSVQLDLFRAPPSQPVWETLPATVKDETIQYLAQLLSNAQRQSDEEVRDER